MRMNWKLRLIVAVAVLIVIAGSYFAYNYHPLSGRTLVVYTYSSLFTYAPNVSAVNNTVFGAFERTYNIHIQLVRFDGTEDMLNALIKQKDNPQADLVIGLTNVEDAQAVSQGVLQNYTPPNLQYVPSFLVKDLDPNHYLVPYEYAPITVDYCNTSSSPASNMSFEYLTEPAVARHLVLENPTVDSTGLSFLLYQITFYQFVLHENWENWWKQVEPYANIQPSWDAAFTVFPSNGYNLVVSYGSDPAYFDYYGGYSGCGTAAMRYDGQVYTWLEIEGMGIVRGAHNAALAEQFENWFLSETVQSQIPTSEWVFPASTQVVLPAIYAETVGANGTVVLNNYVSEQEIGTNLTTWLSEWQQAVGG
jgi:thiamine transport system substrate-binding protein